MIQIFANSYEYKAIWTAPAGNRQGVKHGKNDTFSKFSLSRAKSKIREYALNKNFNAFCTFTFSPRDWNRSDFNACKKAITEYMYRDMKLTSWLLVPELHQDGSIHFHGLIHIDKKKCTYGYTKVSDKGVSFQHYYLPCVNEKFGRNDIQFFETENKLAAIGAVTYICKYLSKDVFTAFGLSYFCARGMKTDILWAKLETRRQVDGFVAFAKAHNLREYHTSHYCLFEISEDLFFEYYYYKELWEEKARPCHSNIKSFEPEQLKF